MKGKTLYLFTAGYPYGIKDEPFLENEIAYLADAFDKIVIFPKSKPSKDKRVTPSNVEVNDCINQAELKNKKLVILNNLFFVLKIVLPSAYKPKNVISFWKNFKLLSDILAQGIIRGKTLKKELKNIDLSNAVFYDYWFTNSFYSISYLKKYRKIKKFVCRGHRYDIYKENWPTNEVPFLTYRIKNVDELYLISKHGYDHLKNVSHPKYWDKLKLSYLGVINHNSDCSIKKVSDENFVIVSCARVVDFKRVHEIPLILKNITSPVKWIHFGDGPLFDKLKENCKLLPSNIEVDLRGYVSNEDVIDYYKKYKVDLFISISLSEGLPVSMMEALSFGIPIIAVDAGGVNEIVCNENGVLIDMNADFSAISTIINRFIKENDLNPSEIIELFDENFSASKNYTKFIFHLNN
jgi:glycosyltransferase involved in cell wall biosynthesis